MKKIFLVFLISFFLNLVWENAHSLLYAQYQGGPITEFILLRASLFDALLTVLFVTPFFYNSFLKKHPWIIIVLGVVIAICIEWYAHETGRWTYNSLMPLIPYTYLGLTPTIQLGLLGFFTYKITKVKTT